MDGYEYPSEDRNEEEYHYEYSSTQTSHHYNTKTYGYPGNDGQGDMNDPKFTPDDFENPNPNYPQPPTSKYNPGPDPVPYGGMVTDHTEQIPGNEFYLHVDPSVKKEDMDNFQLSNCQGKKRALLIGINYTGTDNELNGCINDVANMKDFITTMYGFDEEDMVILTDDQEEEKFMPTRENILAAMKWLVHDAEPDDSFFLHYSGHGGRVADLEGDEDDDFDETIYPLDFEDYEGESGQITDDLMHDLLVRPLPPKCRLTAIFDSCHSGTVLDLPYVYSTKGEIKTTNLFKFAGKGILSAGMAYAQGDKDGALSSLISLGRDLMDSRRATEDLRKNNTSQADVIMFSGCKDDQTSADATEAGKATGAMSYAFTTTLRENPEQTYQELLNSVRDILREKYSQRPQMSSSHPIDVNLQFTC